MLEFGSKVFKFEVMQFLLRLVPLEEMQFITKIRGLWLGGGDENH